MVRDKWRPGFNFGLSEKLALERANGAPLLAQDPKHAAWRQAFILCNTFFMERYKILLYRYCRGDDLKDLRAWLPSVVEALEVADRATQEKNTPPQRALHIEGDLHTPFTLLAFALGLRADPDLLTRLFACLPPGDAFMDRVVVALGDSRAPGQTLLLPKRYRGLYEVLDAPAAQQPALIRKYLDHWPKVLKDMGKWGTHEPTSGGHSGYWCFEAAVVARVCSIDDSGFADHEFYPEELMHWSGPEGGDGV